MSQRIRISLSPIRLTTLTVSPMLHSPVGARWTRYKSVDGGWYDSNPYGTAYQLGSSISIHNGADLQLPGNLDKDKPVYAIADGVVHFAKHVPTHIGRASTWGNLIVLKHGDFHTRYGHLAKMLVQEGQQVVAGQIIGTIGKSGMEYMTNGEHLHFDVSTSGILDKQPMFWAGGNRDLVQQHFVDPLNFIFQPQSATEIVVISDLHLRIRKQPITTAPIVGYLQPGARTRVFLADEWSQLENRQGWVSTQWIKPASAINQISVGVNTDPRNPVGNPLPAQLLPMRYARFAINALAQTDANALQRAIDTYRGIVDSYRQAGVRPIIVLTHQTWGEGRGFNWNAMSAADWERFTAGFAASAAQVAQAFGTGVVYQVFNEGDQASEAAVYIPPVQYAILLDSTVQAIRKHVPQAWIISQGHVSGDSTYWQRVRVTSRTADTLTAVAVHPYGIGGGAFGWNGTVQALLRNWRQVTKLPIWFTEFGVCNGNATSVPDAVAADYAKRFLAGCRADGVPVALWYGWRDGMHSCLGVTDHIGSKRPKLWAALTEGLA